MQFIQLVKLLISFKKSWHTIYGLFFYSIGLSILSLLLVPLFNSAFPENKASLEIFSIGLIVILLVHLIVWLIAKVLERYVPSKANKINIAISIVANKKGQHMNLDAINKFRQKLFESDELNRFNIFNLSNNKKFVNDKTVEKFIQNEGIDLLIWGIAERGKINNIDTTVFRLKFSYNFLTLAKNEVEHYQRQKNFTDDIDNALAGRLWKITRPNTIPDLQVISENLSEVSLYIIIKILVSVGYWKVSLDYCDQLLRLLKNFEHKNTFPNYFNFVDMVRQTSSDLSNSISYYYSISKNNFRLGGIFAKKALTYIPNYFPALINMARISWFFGDEQNARMYTNRAKKVDPSSNLVRVNKAFFYLKDKNYQKAISAYKKIKEIPEGSNIFDITSFLYSAFEKTEEPAYLFGSGILNYRFGDSVTGRMELEKFLQIVYSNDPYIELVQYSKSILSTLKSQD